MKHVDGTIQVPSFALPESSLLNEETHAALKSSRERLKEEYAAIEKDCPSMDGAPREQMPAIRRCQAEAFYRSSSYKRLHERYSVVMTPEETDGVYTEIFTPAEGIASKNHNRVLLNLHGGGFQGGARTGSHLESVPIASVGKIKVISVDYRQGPEYTFPAASEDVAAVYQQLLTTYNPKNIGIYGCSAGGLLTAQIIARLQKSGLPLPGAVGMFFEGAGFWTEGDFGHIGAALIGMTSLGTMRESSYFQGVDPNDPLAFPARSPQVLAKFPPSLLMASTRDFALSSVVHTHSLLVAQGVAADLHVWEGLGHAFFYDADLPQSREAYDVIVRFFDRHLGK